MRALTMSNKVLNARPMQVIEAPKADAVPVETGDGSAPDHSHLPAPVSRGGFSKRRF